MNNRKWRETPEIPVEQVKWLIAFTCRCYCGCRSKFAITGIANICIHCAANDHLSERDD